MEGIDYIIDEKGNKKAIIIAFDIYGSHIEDIEDMLVALARKNEPRVTLAEVEEKYIKQRIDV